MNFDQTFMNLYNINIIELTDDNSKFNFGQTQSQSK